MSQSRKKKRSTSNKNNKYPTQYTGSDDVLNKLDGLRSNIKQEHKKIAPTVQSNRNQVIAVVVIIVVATIGVVALYNPGGINPFVPTRSNTNIVSTVDGFQKDTLAPILISGGKVDFLYIGGQYCPFCGMQRWAIVMALQHFGTFSGLSAITSAEDNVPTYDFVGVTYTSNYVNFQGVEVWNNVAPPNQQHLESLNSQQSALYSKYGTGSIPFICIGGSVFRSGAGSSLNVGSFSGQSFNTVQSQIKLKSGPLYNQISTESNYLIQIINTLLASQTTSTTTTATNTTA